MGGRRDRAGAGLCLAAVLVGVGIAVLAAVGPALAQQQQRWISPCLHYIGWAEQQFQIPRGILHAIALTESGFQGQPHPFALNIGGAPHYPTDANTALRLIQRADGTFRPEADVGCMQISIRYHGETVRNPAYLLNPRFNVSYGAYYLRSLYMEHGDWTTAIARYHSGNRQRQIIYLCKVWRNLIKVGGPARRTTPGICM